MFVPLYDHNKREHVVAPLVNYALIAVTVLVFAVFQSGLVLDASYGAALGFGMIPALVTDAAELPPELYYVPAEFSLVTYAFLHGSWLHLGGNMLFLWVFGDNIEDALGHIRYLIFYLLAAIAGALGELALAPQAQIPLVGASGATSGIIGAYLMLHPNVRVWVLAFNKIPVKIPAAWCLVAWFLFQIVFFAIDETNEVAWMAHIAGFVCGAILIVFMRRRGVPLFDRD